MGDPVQTTSPPANTSSPKSPSRSPTNPASSPIAGTAPLVVDENLEEDDDMGIEMGAESDTTSLKSSILKYRVENGRSYHAYKDGAYVLPNDDDENERLDLQHTIFLLTFDHKLYAAPIEKQPGRVLDAGCGTGIWSIEYADENPDAQVVGIDLSPIQPAFVPPNVEFFVDDIEDDWTFSTRFDFIFARFLTGSVKDWPRFIRQSYENLNPGGWVELQDIVGYVSCDDDTLAKDAPLKRWSDNLFRAFSLIGRPQNSVLHYQQQLSDAGFVNAGTVKEKWPTNRWPRDKKYKQIGIWNLENMVSALGALTLALFTRPENEGGLGWTREEAEVLLAGVRKDLKNTSIHAYWQIHSVFAQKPEAAA